MLINVLDHTRKGGADALRKFVPDQHKMKLKNLVNWALNWASSANFMMSVSPVQGPVHQIFQLHLVLIWDKFSQGPSFHDVIQDIDEHRPTANVQTAFNTVCDDCFLP